MASARRIGAADSSSRTHLLDVAEEMLLEGGYAAVTSRKLGARAEVSPQLVHYYFRTMDELFVEVFRRRAEQGLERAAEALAEDASLVSIWELTRNPLGARFNLEFAALAIGPETCPPTVALLVMTGLSQIMSIESSFGLTTGHDETRRFVRDLLERIEAGEVPTPG